MIDPEDQAWGPPPPSNYKWALPRFSRKKQQSTPSSRSWIRLIPGMISMIPWPMDPCLLSFIYPFTSLHFAKVDAKSWHSPRACPLDSIDASSLRQSTFDSSLFSCIPAYPHKTTSLTLIAPSKPLVCNTHPPFILLFLSISHGLHLNFFLYRSLSQTTHFGLRLVLPHTSMAHGLHTCSRTDINLGCLSHFQCFPSHHLLSAFHAHQI